MVRIAGVNLDNNKRILIGLTSIYGVGPTTAAKILQTCRIQNNPKTKDLTEEEVDKIRTFIDKNLTVETDAKIITNRNIKRLRDIGTYRGLRHTAHLPVRGQRTKTNARTRKGPKVTMGSGRKKAAAKT
jgi:small subunit ribosomal protein S13